VVFASTSPAVCSVAGSTVTMLSAGTCALTANQAGNADYSAAVQATLDVAITAGAQSISFGAQQAVVFAPNATVALAPVATASSGLPVSYSSQTSSVCSISGSTVTMLSAGNCVIAADQAGDGNWDAAAQVTRSIAIGQATQAITGFAANPSAPVFIPNGTFSVSANGGASSAPLLFASTSPDVCTVNGSTVSMLSAGTCALTANQAGDGNYSAAAQQTLSVVIGAGAQSINFGAQPGVVFVANGTVVLNPLATASSGLPVTYSSQTSAVCSISGTTVTMLSAGSCVVAADQAGDDNWSAAAQVTQAITIGQASQSITGFAANPTAPVYSAGGSFQVAASGGASGLPVVFGSTSQAVCTVSGSTVTMLSAGTCTLTADQAGNDSYSAAARQTLEVAIDKGLPTLSWAGDMSRVLSEANFELPEPTSTSTGAFTYTSSNTLVATSDGRRVTLVGAGVTTLTATQAASANYAQASISLVLTVDGRPDPTQDPSVAAGLQAQLDASVRFVQAQQDNIRGRLTQLRQGGNNSSNAMTLAMQGGMDDPGLSLRADQMGATAPKLPAGWGFWSAGSITLGERDPRGTRNGFDFRSDGVSIGVDRQLGENWVVGGAGGMGWNDTDFDDGGSSLDARQHSLALYGAWKAQQWFVDGLLGWGQLDFDIKRHSTAADALATATRGGDQQFASVTLGYDHQREHSTLTGYGRLDASRTALDAYRERGLGIYDLQYARQDVDSSSAAVGVEGRYSFRTAAAMVRPSWLLEWRQALRNQGDASLDYAVAPRDGGYVLGLRSYNDDMLAFGAGIDVGFDNGWSLSFQYRREQARDVFANTFGLRLGYGRALQLTPEQLWQQGNSLTTPKLEAAPAAKRP